MWSNPFLWIFLALVLFWAVGAYNRLVRLRSTAIQAFGALDAHLMRWVAMLGEFDAACLTASADARAALRGAVTQLGASLAVARARPLQADAVAALASARNVLDATWHTALESASAEPGDALTHWKVRWDEHCTQSGLAVQGFDAAVAQYNAAIAQFPARLLAWVFGFKAARTLQPVQESSSP